MQGVHIIFSLGASYSSDFQQPSNYCFYHCFTDNFVLLLEFWANISKCMCRNCVKVYRCTVFLLPKYTPGQRHCKGKTLCSEIKYSCKLWNRPFEKDEEIGHSPSENYSCILWRARNTCRPSYMSRAGMFRSFDLFCVKTNGCVRAIPTWGVYRLQCTCI